MFYGIEMANGGWDLFCSRECCTKIHPLENPTMFPTVTDYYEALNPYGLDLQMPYMGGRMCFNCCGVLPIHLINRDEK